MKRPAVPRRKGESVYSHGGVGAPVNNEKNALPPGSASSVLDGQYVPGYAPPSVSTFWPVM